MIETIAFGSLDITFDQRVLRPREWTAEQSRWAAELIGAAPSGPVLELCSGAGQIGLLAIATEPRELVCVDLDPVACDFARDNALDAGLADLVEVRQGDLEAVLGTDEMFAVVIADPPWVRHGDTGRYPEDPLLAIDGGADGLDVARTCLRVGSGHLLPGGSMVLQVGTSQQAADLGPDLATYGDLEVVEVRSCEGGALVRLDRPDRSDRSGDEIAT